MNLDHDLRIKRKRGVLTPPKIVEATVSTKDDDRTTPFHAGAVRLCRSGRNGRMKDDLASESAWKLGRATFLDEGRVLLHHRLQESSPQLRPKSPHCRPIEQVPASARRVDLDLAPGDPRGAHGRFDPKETHVHPWRRR